MIAISRVKAGLLSATMLTVSMAGTHAQAQVEVAAAEAAADFDDAIVVTATRRATSLADVPINITAIGSETLKDQRIDDVRGLAAFTPGVTILDTGPRGTGTIVLRGLNADDTGTSGSNADNAVAIYLGEVPLYLDFKLLDMQRVEVLLGPQGTLYGVGTLAGAIRYIPNRPDASSKGLSGEAHGRLASRASSQDIGYQGDLTVNIPIVTDHIALRTMNGYFFEPGFIDYALLLQNPGTSLPQPGGSTIGDDAQYAANLRRERDANFEKTFTSRSSLLLQTNDNIKGYLTYAYQKTRTDGRQANGAGVLGTGKYEAPWRYLEPQERKSQLLAAELDINLFNVAQLVTASAFTKQNIKSQFDNTDLLLDLDYDYELFPAFSSYAPQHSTTKQFNQEVRLVSKHGGPFSWVVGGFYNELKFTNRRDEYVPGYTAFIGDTRRPDDLEYISFVRTKTVEKAVFGEGTINFTDNFQVTGGGRYYKYEADATGGTDLPLTSGGRRRTPYPLIQFDPSRVRSGSTSSDGFVYKINTSYKFREGLLVYGTYSTGYRIGGVNRVPPCIIPLPPGQNVCALPNELTYGPDKTKNKEIGVRAGLFDNRLTLNLAVYHIDWNDVQVGSQTVNGAVGVTINAAKAVSKGVELTASARLTSNLTLSGSYAYNDAALTADAPGLVTGVDAFDGDRLPGSARHQGSAIANYTMPLANGDDIVGTWALTYQGNVLSRVGNRNFGETIPDYILNRATVFYRAKKMEFGVYANNIFNVYAVSGIGQDFSKQTVNDGQFLRYYNRSVITPRTVGVEARYRF